MGDPDRGKDLVKFSLKVGQSCAIYLPAFIVALNMSETLRSPWSEIRGTHNADDPLDESPNLLCMSIFSFSLEMLDGKA